MTKVKSNTALKVDSELCLKPPAYPKLANEVIRELKRMLDEAERPVGQALTQKEFGRLVGVPRSTIHDWYHGNLVEPLMRLVCALERLSETQRTTLFRKLCRKCPRLQHAHIAHDPKAVNSLRGVLAKPAGLTFVIGATAKQRTFLITALGNSVTQLMPEKVVSGIDVHTPVDFVPVAGVCYLRKVSNSPQCSNSILQLWEEIKSRPTDMVLLNGVWNMIPEVRRRAVELAKERNIIVADEFAAPTELGKREGKLTSFVRIRRGDLGDEIHIEVEPDVA
jgi:DNA-binding XRE family transcriptional regulator